MKKIVIIIIALFFAPFIANSAQQTWSAGDDLSAIRVKLQANDTDLYNQEATKWVPDGHAYIAGINAVVHGSDIYICTTTHNSSAAGVAGNEPGTGGNWQDVWRIVPRQDTDTHLTDAQVESAYNSQVPQVSSGEIAAGTGTGVRRFSPADVKGFVDAFAGSGGATAINDLTDVDTTGKSTGKVLKFNSSGNLVVGDDNTGDPGSGEENVQADWNVTDNTSDAYIKNKPTTITTQQASDINTNNAKISFDSASSSKLAGIAAGAEVNVQSDWNASTGDAFIANKPTISGSNTGDVTISTANGLSLSGQALSLAASTNATPGAATAAQISELERLSAVAPAGSNTHYGLILNNNTTSYADCTSGVYGFNYVDGTAYMCINGTQTAIPASSTGMTNPMTTSGDMIKGGASGAPTRMAPGTGIVAFLETPSTTNFFTALTGEGAFAATLFGYADAAAVYGGIKQAASTTASGASELATTAETTTGTDAARTVTPDGLSGSVYGQKEIGWTVVNDTTDTAVADGLQAGVIPASMNGMNLMDVTCSVGSITGATSGTTTVVLRRVRGATAVDMTSTGVTIDYNAYTASDETVNTANDDVATGDKIFVDINAVSAGAAAKGLSCTAVFQTP